MGRQGSLGGRGQFAKILRNGRRISGTQIRAAYVVVQREACSLRCGISIPRQTGNAVHRNRVRRLIREAIRFRQDEIQRIAGPASVGVDIVFQFRLAATLPLHRLSLHHIMPDVEKIFGTITGRITQGKP